MADRPDVDSFLPLPASVMHIVVALADGEKHGYAIMRDVAMLSDGTVRMGSGTLYGSIKRMLDQGLIEETDERPTPRSTTSAASTTGSPNSGTASVPPSTAACARW